MLFQTRSEEPVMLQKPQTHANSHRYDSSAVLLDFSTLYEEQTDI